MDDTKEQKIKQRVQECRWITSTLSQDALNKFGDHILELQPRDMLTAIVEDNGADSSPAAHEALRARTEAFLTKICRKSEMFDTFSG